MKTSIISLFCAGLVTAGAVSAQSNAPATPAARWAVAKMGQCIARSSTAKVHEVLTSDFRTPAYRSGLRVLADNNRDCYRSRGTMRAGGLPFAAALAEAMLSADPRPLRNRLAAAAVGKTAATYAPSAAVAMCIARSAPNEASDQLSSPIASTAETEAAAKLTIALRLCAQRLNVPMDQQETYGLRAILATAAYRLLAAQGTAG